MDIILNEAIPNDWDGLLILFGREGSGKTTLATQLCKYLDPKFDIDRCVFTPAQFTEAIDSLPDESAILWDEAITGANISTHASEISIAIVSKLTQIRKKRLKIFLCFPYLHMLNKYFVSRCICSIYVYAKDFTDRGYGFFYSQPQTEFLYNYMKEHFRYMPMDAIKKSKHAFYFKYSKHFYLPKNIYDTKKETARIDGDNSADKWKTRAVKLLKLLRKEHKTPYKLLAKELDVSDAYLRGLACN